MTVALNLPALALPRPIDPFARGRAGRYEDDVVVVERRRGLRTVAGERIDQRLGKLAVGREDERVLLLHDLPDAAIDNDLAGLLDRELFQPGWVVGPDTFERLFTGVVLTCRELPLDAWELFYRGTLHRIDEQGGGAGHEGCIAGMAPVYRHAEALVAETLAGEAGRVLDLGSCFGFFPLRLAAGRAGRGVRAIASDLTPGTCELLDRICIRLQLPIRALTCDAAHVPLPSAGADVVTAMHVLEHVDAAHGRRILAEAARVARRRVVIAVPLEDEPNAAFGHVRTIGLDDLAASARDIGPGWTWDVTEHHGGWLVLDRV